MNRYSLIWLLLCFIVVGCTSKNIEQNSQVRLKQQVADIQIPLLVQDRRTKLIYHATWQLNRSFNINSTPVIKVPNEATELYWDGEKTVYMNGKVNMLTDDLEVVAIGSNYVSMDSPLGARIDPQKGEVILFNHNQSNESVESCKLPQEALNDPNTAVIWANGSIDKFNLLVHYFVVRTDHDSVPSSWSGLLLGSGENGSIKWSTLGADDLLVGWQLPQSVLTDKRVYLGGMEELLEVDLTNAKLDQDITINKALRSLITTGEVEERVSGPGLGQYQDILLVSLFIGDSEYILAFKDGQKLGSLVVMPDKVEVWNKNEKTIEKTLPWKSILTILPKGHVRT